MEARLNNIGDFLELNTDQRHFILTKMLKEKETGMMHNRYRFPYIAVECGFCTLAQANDAFINQAREKANAAFLDAEAVIGLEDVYFARPHSFGSSNRVTPPSPRPNRMDAIIASADMAELMVLLIRNNAELMMECSVSIADARLLTMGLIECDVINKTEAIAQLESVKAGLALSANRCMVGEIMETYIRNRSAEISAVINPSHVQRLDNARSSNVWALG